MSTSRSRGEKREERKGGRGNFNGAVYLTRARAFRSFPPSLFSSFPFTLFSLLCFLLFCAPAAARADRVDELVRARMSERHVPGLALAVVREGRVVKARGYGLASVELNVAVTPETVFEIGSITKQLTAAAVMLLVEEGKLKLDDPVRKYLPEAPEAWNEVTVRHLLTHTSGIRNYTGLPGFELTERLTRAQFIKLVSAHPLNFRPGAQWSYGNTAYNLLGHVVERASGQSYWSFVEARLFRPLGMTSTRDRDPRQVIPNRANGYEWERGRLVGRDYDLTDVFSAGATTSTVLDLARWDAALYTDRLLKESSRAEMWTPVRLAGGASYPYGLGWYTLNFRGHRLVRHGGQTAGFSAHIARFVEDKLTVIVLSNLGDIGLAGEVGLLVAKTYLPDLSLKSIKPPTDPEPRLSAQLRQLLIERLQGQLDSELLTKEARASLGSERNRETARRLASHGALKAFDYVERDFQQNPSGAERALRFRALFERRATLLRFNLNAEGKVAGMSVEEEE